MNLHRKVAKTCTLATVACCKCMTSIILIQRYYLTSKISIRKSAYSNEYPIRATTTS